MTHQNKPARTSRATVESLEVRSMLSASGLVDDTSPAWAGFGGDSSHTAISAAASQPLKSIHWQTSVDLNPQSQSGELLIHYGSPVITRKNTVIFPVKTGADSGFRLEARDGATGKLKWVVDTDYLLPPHFFVPSDSPVLAPSGRLYFAGAGGTIDYVDKPDVAGAPVVHQLAYYGISSYLANKSTIDSSVFIDTPLTADKAGNIFFGIQVTSTNPLHLNGGLARISAAGVGKFASAAAASGAASDDKVAQNCAPAISVGGHFVYVAVNSTLGIGVGAAIRSSNYLLMFNSTTLAVHAKVRLVDPASGLDADVVDEATSSPMVGPNGDVYFGVLDNPPNTNHGRGWLLHFNWDLTKTKTPGAFGWDDTASVVPASMVKNYHGSSSYLIMTKYNNYVEDGGNGINQLAVLDPNAGQVDSVTNTAAMKPVLTITGVTPDPDYTQLYPLAVKEWCVNTTAVDPATDSILVNSEDGTLYRWDLSKNKLTQSVKLTHGVAEAYTPTVIGADGTVYAMNDAILFAVGK